MFRFPLFRSFCLFPTRFLSLPLFITIRCVLVLVLLRVLSIFRIICFGPVLAFRRVYLLSGYVCSRLDSQVRRVIPRLSSSELSSHQMARPNPVRSLLPSCALIKSLTARGSTTARRAVRELLLCSLPLRLRGRQCCARSLCAQHSTSTSGSNRRVPPPRGSRLASPSRAPPSSCFSSLVFLLYEASPHAEVRRLRIHAPVGLLSLLRLLRHPSCGRLSACTTCFGGGRTCFPVRDCRCLPGSHPISPRCCLDVPRSRFAPGRSDEFPGRDCVHLRVHCCIALFVRFLSGHDLRAFCGQTLQLGLVGAPALVCAVS